MKIITFSKKICIHKYIMYFKFCSIRMNTNLNLLDSTYSYNYSKMIKPFNLNKFSKNFLLDSRNKLWYVMMPRLFCQVSNWIVESTDITLLKLQHQPVADARLYILNGSIFHFSISFQWRFSMIYNKHYSFFCEVVSVYVMWKCVCTSISTFDIIALPKAKWLVRNRKYC